MHDDLSEILAVRDPTGARPLLGLTVLVVEDSRFACDALRLMCLRSGARIRRADCLASARRHLRCYRPSVVIVDLGLPDGCGIDLIGELAGLAPRVPALFGTSGDSARGRDAIAAGADGFLVKPLESLAAFQQTVLRTLARPTRPDLTTAGAEDRIVPDPLAFRDDLAHAAAVLRANPDHKTLGYIGQFLTGVARSAHDTALQSAAETLLRDQQAGRSTARTMSRISGLVQDRLTMHADM